MDAVFNDNVALTSSFRQGDEKALVIYFNTFYPALCSYAFSYAHDMETAKEIAAEAFYKTWKYRQQFINPGSIRAYLYTIVRRDAAYWHQQKKRFTITALPGDEAIESPEPDEFAKLVKAETLRQLYNAIEQLPVECRKVFRMLYVEGKKVKEIAEELNISPSTVKAQKARGISLLRKKITLLVLSISLLVEKIMVSL
jgi:RNA polymerase sigma-70 factor (ECF subfamily)